MVGLLSVISGIIAVHKDTNALVAKEIQSFLVKSVAKMPKSQQLP
jgi:hypothetical protein